MTSSLMVTLLFQVVTSLCLSISLNMGVLLQMLIESKGRNATDAPGKGSAE